MSEPEPPIPQRRVYARTPDIVPRRIAGDTILVAVRPYRGEAPARLEEGGVYQTLEGVRRALWHQDLGLLIVPFSLEREEAWLTTRELAVYGAQYRTGYVQNF